MANQEQLEILKKGVEIWNKWRKDNITVKIILAGANLERTNLVRADFSEANLIGANLMGANLARADLMGADLTDANLIGTDLSETHLLGANLMGANLTMVNLTGAYHAGVDFYQANLTGAHLPEANLVEAHLVGANLTSANMARSDLRRAHLWGAKLVGAHLMESNLTDADLSKVDLTKADLRLTILRTANVTDANFKGAKLGGTTFGNNDLSNTVGLELASHLYPSTIGIDTIRKSKGKIPIEFLRGCGLSDLEIESAKLAMPGLDPEQATDITYRIHQLYLGDGIQYYSCFISYSSKNQDFAQRLHDDLQNNGVRCWFDQEHMKIGDPIRPTIDKQIRLRDKLLVILSENSVKSEWVGDEVEAALEEESASDRLVLFPIRLDGAVMETRDDWAAKIKRRRHIGDFSNWKDEGSYRKAFERLLRDLKASGGEVEN